MKRILTALMILLIANLNNLNAQDLLIRHDLITGKTVYFKVKSDGTEVSIPKPFIKKNKKFLLEITNANPFIYNVTFQVTQKSVQNNVDSARNLLTFFTPGVTNIDSFISTVTTRAAIADMIRELNKAFQEIVDDDQAFTTWTTGYYVVSELMISSKFGQQQIVRMMDSTARVVFSLDAVAPYDSRLIVADRVQTLKSHIQRFKDLYAAIKLSIDSGKADKTDAGRAIAENNTVDSIQQLYFKTAYLKKSAAISSLINMTRNADFTNTVEDIAEMDNADITATITRRQVTLFGDSIPDLQAGRITVKKFRIIIRGEAVIRSSIGLSFPTLFKNAVRYEVVDGKVAESKDDNWVPNLTTFISFYPFTGRSSNIGGIIGFGYPISNKANKNINILLGPSLTLGDKNLVILAGGLTIGQTNRLSGGRKIGDAIQDENVEIPVDKKWKTGIFLALSLSIFNK